MREHEYNFDEKKYYKDYKMACFKSDRTKEKHVLKKMKRMQNKMDMSREANTIEDNEENKSSKSLTRNWDDFKEEIENWYMSIPSKARSNAKHYIINKKRHCSKRKNIFLAFFSVLVSAEITILIFVSSNMINELYQEVDKFLEDNSTIVELIKENTSSSLSSLTIGEIFIFNNIKEFCLAYYCIILFLGLFLFVFFGTVLMKNYMIYDDFYSDILQIIENCDNEKIIMRFADNENEWG